MVDPKGHVHGTSLQMAREILLLDFTRWSLSYAIVSSSLCFSSVQFKALLLLSMHVKHLLLRRWTLQLRTIFNSLDMKSVIAHEWGPNGVSIMLFTILHDSDGLWGFKLKSFGCRSGVWGLLHVD